MAAVFRDYEYFPIRGTYASEWRADVDQAGGGCLIEHSIHDVDILRFCFGEVDSLVARTVTTLGHRGVEDLASLSLSFASGLEAQLTSVWHDILSRGSTRRIESSAATAWCGWTTSSAGRCTSRRARAPKCGLVLRRLGRRPAAGRRRDWRGRAGLCRGRPGLCRRGRQRTRPEPGLDVALQAHRLVDAAYRSAADGPAQPASVCGKRATSRLLTTSRRRGPSWPMGPERGTKVRGRPPWWGRPPVALPMDNTALLIELFGRIEPLAAGAAHEITRSSSWWCPSRVPTPSDGSLWHLTRVQDHHVAELLRDRPDLGDGGVGGPLPASRPIRPTPGTATARTMCSPCSQTAPRPPPWLSCR